MKKSKLLLVNRMRLKDVNGRLQRTLYVPVDDEAWDILETLGVHRRYRENGFGETKKQKFEELGINIVVVNGEEEI